MKSVKIGLSLFIVYMISHTPYKYITTFGGPISGYFKFAFYINNLANFFIYFFVDEKFGAALKTL